MNKNVKRVLATVFDLILVSGASFIVLYYLSLLMIFIMLVNGHIVKELQLMNVFSWIAITTMYETICLYVWKGQTIGKRIFGLRVVSIWPSEDEEENAERRPDFYTCLLRSLVKAIMMASFSGVILLLNIGFILLRQTDVMIYDQIAKTTVE